MFEAKLSEGVILKKIVDSIKDIVTDVNIDISPSGKQSLQSPLMVHPYYRKAGSVLKYSKEIDKH